jgi:hypothetical protein
LIYTTPGTFHNQPPAQFISGRHHREICVAGHIHISKLANGQQSCRSTAVGELHVFRAAGKYYYYSNKNGTNNIFEGVVGNVVVMASHRSGGGGKEFDAEENKRAERLAF